MANHADSTALAALARRFYVEGLLKGLPNVVQAIDSAAREQLSKVAENALVMRRRDAVEDLARASPFWLQAATGMLRGALLTGVISASRPSDLPPPSGRSATSDPGLSLVDNDTIETEILSSRLALAMMDKASWEFTDLRSRMTTLEGRDELASNDVLRPHVLARIVTSAWRTSGLGQETWRTVQASLHEEFSHFAAEAYHETNRWLMAEGVLPEIDLRPLIRRTADAGWRPSRLGSATQLTMPTALRGQSVTDNEVSEETRMMTRPGALARGADHSEAVLGRLNRLIGKQLPNFANTSQAAPASPQLTAAIAQAQESINRRLSAGDRHAQSGAQAGAQGGARGGSYSGPRGSEVVSTPALLEELAQRKQQLKQAASTPNERATIEIVALLFQSILTEERIPASIRVWFARLQMPVLRVAVGEPDFFATIDHPARRLIDRMGGCVMGFDSKIRKGGDVIEVEIKRIVQVVEAYPDTGRRVFQTVMTEFDKFLEHYFKNENEASRKGVSLAQQVEQRETLTIQYTIELRKMLNEMPVQEGIREFLFHVWADVLAMTAVTSVGTGTLSDETKAMKRAAADLIWSASAKVSRDERSEVIRRLPPLLKTLREGMKSAGMSTAKQDEHIQSLNSSLAAAFTAKSAAIPVERMEELMGRLETLEELLPEAEDVEIDESMVLDLSGHESSELEVVGEGGSMPTPAMLAWATELQVGSWFMLDFRNRNEPVQLAWQGLRRQLALFVSPQGRGVLFQKHRLAAFLQAGLLVPAQDETLTVRATRSAMEKLDVDPGRLLN
jgi:Protein of unknown function (DUF1631)